MSYHIGDWLVDVNETTITNLITQEVIKLEPIPMELLDLLAQSNGKLVTREELLDKIWKGRAITDHAIYRVITKLRKALSPNDKNAYIVTVSKRGYRLAQECIPNTSETLNIKRITEKSRNQIQKKINKKTAQNTLAGFLGLFLLVILYFQNTKSIPAYIKFTNVMNLTSQLGVEHDPVYIIGTQPFLLYSFKEQNALYSNIFIKNISTEEISQITDNNFHERKITASRDGKVIALLRYNFEGCKVILLTHIEDNKYSERPLFTCNESLTDIELTKNGSLLFYTDVGKTEKPSVYSYAINTGKIQLISKTVDKKSLGEFVISLSPDNKKLAFSRYLDWENSEIGYIELESNIEKTLFQTNSIIGSLAWSHNSEDIYYQDSLNSVKAYSIKTSISKEVVNSISQNLSDIYSSPKENSIILQTKEIIRNKGIWRLSNPLTANYKMTNQLIINSSALDLFPSYANNSKKIAFMSLRTGNNQIWIQDENGEERKLTNFTDGRNIRRFSWSPDDNFILCDWNNEIYAINVSTGERTTYINKGDYGHSGAAIWSMDGSSIFFDSDISGDWQIYKKNISTGEVVQVTKNGGTASFRNDGDDNILYFLKAHQNGLWKLDINEQHETLLIGDIDDTSHLGVSVQGNKIYYYSIDGKMRYFDQNNNQSFDLNLPQIPDIPQFSISHDSRELIFSNNELIDTTLLLLAK